MVRRKNGPWADARGWERAWAGGIAMLSALASGLALAAPGDLDHGFATGGAVPSGSSRFFYLLSCDTPSGNRINQAWSVPLAGGASTKLNRTLASGGDVQAFLISPDSSWVVYGADQDAVVVDNG